MNFVNIWYLLLCCVWDNLPGYFCNAVLSIDIFNIILKLFCLQITNSNARVHWGLQLFYGL